MQINPPSALPQAPRNAYVDVVKATYVEIKWERSPDDIDGLRLRYSVDASPANTRTVMSHVDQV